MSMLGVVVELGTATLKAGFVGFGTVAATDVTVPFVSVGNSVGVPVPSR
jgi:hypothetical protein